MSKVFEISDDTVIIKTSEIEDRCGNDIEVTLRKGLHENKRIMVYHDIRCSSKIIIRSSIDIQELGIYNKTLDHHINVDIQSACNICILRVEDFSLLSIYSWDIEYIILNNITSMYIPTLKVHFLRWNSDSFLSSTHKIKYHTYDSISYKNSYIFMKDDIIFTIHEDNHILVSLTTDKFIGSDLKKELSNYMPFLI